ncbi:DUF2281 domain-containing protein [Dehalococcoidia bacterium]|nr:DUF2281 domain-containing protein [Dehalococcoidia bacterium]
MRTVNELIAQLPPDLQQEVGDFAEFLLPRLPGKRNGELKLDWKGAIKDLRDDYTSVELQHKASEWWGTDVSS